MTLLRPDEVQAGEGGTRQTSFHISAFELRLTSPSLRRSTVVSMPKVSLDWSASPPAVDVIIKIRNIGSITTSCKSFLCLSRLPKAGQSPMSKIVRSNGQKADRQIHASLDLHRELYIEDGATWPVTTRPGQVTSPRVEFNNFRGGLFKAVGL